MKSSELRSCSCKLSAVYRTLFVVNLLACLAVSPGRAADSTIAWGNNNNLQTDVPPSVTGVVALSAGTLHSLALRTDGTVIGWGDNFFGQANMAGLTQVKAIAAGGTFSLALLSNGTVVVRGTQPPAPPGLNNVTAIAAGWKHALALQSNGTVVSWGDTNLVPAGLNNVVAIAAGDGHSLALLADRTVVAWGETNYNKTVVPPGLSNVVAIAAGKDHCAVLQWNGKVTAWGRNEDGQATVPPSLSNVVAIAAGGFHTVALRNNGSIVAWGNNTFAQSDVPGWTRFYHVAAGGYHNLGQLGDSQPVITVQPRTQQIPVTKSATFAVLASGSQPMLYQWRKNGENLSGRTNQLLTLSNITLDDAGDYSVNIVNSNGAATSLNAALIPFFEPPQIAEHPSDRTNTCGETATFNITATGSQPLSYQWWFEGSTIPDATNATLTLSNLVTSQAGGYSVVVTNQAGAVTSTVAQLTVLVDPPLITSALQAFGRQGANFSYKINAIRTPIAFAAAQLPLGLAINPTNGIISGVPLEDGVFYPIITAINQCTSHSEILTLTFNSGAPVITSATVLTGNENTNLTYQITATGAPDSFGAQNLPDGLFLNPVTGLISGAPVFAGTHQAWISASNGWGVGTSPLTIIVTNRAIEGLSIANVTYTYSSPYLVDFEFSLRDSTNAFAGNAVVVPPNLLVAITRENDRTNSPSETGTRIALGSTKQLKVNLVLDFTESLANLAGGDSNGDGISDAVEQMIASAQLFVNQQSAGAQIGVFEFHREDLEPQQVVPLTTDKQLINSAIAGIWTNYVQDFPASSRCWDALQLAITDLGPANPDEQHYVVFISDGEDESSLITLEDVIQTATNSGVKIFAIGFGDAVNTTNLTSITDATKGRYYPATDAAALGEQFALISKDLYGQYVLRWATLKRSSTAFLPSFTILLGTNEATVPIPAFTTYDVEEIDPDTGETNTVTMTNYVFEPYIPTEHTGPVSVGALRLTPDAAVVPTSMTLRASYVPRFIRQLRIHYRANWPCTTTLLSTNVGEILHGWSLTETNDGAGGAWLLLSAAFPQSTSNSIPFASFGDLVRFNFKDVVTTSNAFSLFSVDNTLYTNTGGQSFVISNANTFISAYTNLPYGTPIPWMLAHGIDKNFDTAELEDPDNDGVPTWQEYRANTDPQDLNSRFVVRGLSNDIYGRYFVTFTTAVNRHYRVETSSDLVNWEVVEDAIVGTGADVTVLDRRYIPWITQVFYRVTVY